MAASKRFIILDRPQTRTVKIVFWLDVPATRQAFYAKPGAVSAWKDAAPADNAALVDGSVTEQVDTLNFDGALSNATIIQALKDEWTARQAAVTAFNPWTNYGTFWPADGSAIVPGGVS